MRTSSVTEKKVYRYTTYGTITVYEKVFLQNGRLTRPFTRTAGIACGGCSHLPQRGVTDFGSDVPFGGFSEKPEEHYGISVPCSAAREITGKHAEAVKEEEKLLNALPDKTGAEYIIAETDGTMIPVLEKTDETGGSEPGGLRKARKGKRREARLTPAHPAGSVAPYFGCAPGGPDDAGDCLMNCAVRSGLGRNTEVHGAGDGAPRISRRIDRVFDGRAGYPVDFYHLREYLSSASKVRAPDDYSDFFSGLKQLMRENRSADVPEKLKPHIEPDSVPDEKAPVRLRRRYIENRPGRFNYKEASGKGLPVGSGEIKSACRYIIQDRIKIAGGMAEGGKRTEYYRVKNIACKRRAGRLSGK